MAYLVAGGGNSAKLVKSEFDKVSSIARHEAGKIVEKSFENRVIFTSTFNPRGLNVSQIIIRRLNLIKNSLFHHNIFPDGSIVVASKHCENVQDLLVCGDRYNIINIKHDLTHCSPSIATMK